MKTAFWLCRTAMTFGVCVMFTAALLLAVRRWGEDAVVILGGSFFLLANLAGFIEGVYMRYPLAVLLVLVATAAPAIDAGGPDNHGEQITVDLPTDLHRRNTSSKGLGNCVWTSIHHCALYHSVPALEEFPKWLIAAGIPGGGSPGKVADLIPQIARSRGLPVPDYIQHTGGDAEFLKLALRTGRYVAVTYAGSDGVYYSGGVDHMVNLVHLSDQWAVIMDNNNPGKYLWMTPNEFLARWRARGGGWALVLLAPPPPPIPRNK